MSYPTLLYDCQGVDGPFSAQGNPDSMLTSMGTRSSFSFNMMMDANDSFSSTEECSNNRVQLKAQSNEEWFHHAQFWVGVPASPLLAELSPLSTLSSASTLSASRDVSPFSLTPTSREIQLPSDSDALISRALCFEQEPKTINPASLSVSSPLSASCTVPAPQEIQLAVDANASNRNSGVRLLEPEPNTVQSSSLSSSPLLIPFSPLPVADASKPSSHSSSPLSLSHAASPVNRPSREGEILAHVQSSACPWPEDDRLESSTSTNSNDVVAVSAAGNQGTNNNQLILDIVQHSAQISHESSIPGTSEQQQVDFCSNPPQRKVAAGHTSYSQYNESLPFITESVRTYATRRAATATKRRLAALFEEDEDEDLRENVRLSKSARTKKTTSGGNSRDKRKSGVRTSSSGTRRAQDLERNSRAHSSGPPSSTRRDVKLTTYADLEREGHPITLSPSVRNFLYSPAQCDSCRRGFKRKPDLVRHLETTHQRRDLFCPKCKTEFSSRGDALRRHLERNTCRWNEPRKRRIQKYEPKEGPSKRRARKRAATEDSDDDQEDYWE